MSKRNKTFLLERIFLPSEKQINKKYNATESTKASNEPLDPVRYSITKTRKERITKVILKTKFLIIVTPYKRKQARDVRTIAAKFGLDKYKVRSVLFCPINTSSNLKIKTRSKMLDKRALKATQKIATILDVLFLKQQYAKTKEEIKDIYFLQ